MFEGGFLIEKRHLLPLLSKLRPTYGVVSKLVELPRDWEQLADGDWAIVHFKSEDSGNIGYVKGPMFADLGVYMLKIEGFVCISCLDYPGAKSCAYSGYDTLEYKTADPKSGISAAVKHSKKAMGHPSLLSKEAGRYNGRRNADKLIPGEVLPPCVETESRSLIKNGVLMQYLGHEEEVTIPDTCTSIGVRAFKDQTQLRRVVVPKSVKDIGESAFEGCPRLTGITLPASLTEIGEKAFEDHGGKPSSMPRRAAVRSGTPGRTTSSFSRCEKGRGLCMSEEELRELLAEVYAGAFSGLGAMLLDEDRIRNAGTEELARNS